MPRIFSTLLRSLAARIQRWGGSVVKKPTHSGTLRIPDIPKARMGLLCFWIEPPEWRSFCLLTKCLDRNQRRSLLDRGFFTVRTPSGDRYNIEYGGSYSVLESSDSSRPFAYCAIPNCSMPIWDNMLTLKLYLEAAPSIFFRCANKTRTNPAEVESRRERCKGQALVLYKMLPSTWRKLFKK